MATATIVARAIRERVALNKLPPGPQRDRAEEGLDRYGEWFLLELEKDTAGLPPFGSKPAPPPVARGRRERCPCGCGVVFRGLTPERREHLRKHPHQRGIRTTNRRALFA